MPPTNLFGLGYGVGPAGYGYPSVGRWSPLSLGSSLAAWYRADAGCYTDAACLFASASSQYLSKTSPTFAPTTKMTIAFDWKPTSDGVMHPIAIRYGAEPQFFARITSGNVAELRLYKDAGGTTITITGATALLAGVNHRIVFVYDGTQAVAANRAAIYVDGAAESLTIGGTIPTTLDASTAPLIIGDDTFGTFANGALARLGFSSLALSGAALTAAHTSTFWASMTAARQADWFSFYNLCEASSTRVDSTGLNNLTPTNGPTVAAGPGEGLCVDNSPCKRIEDQSGNGRHATQVSIAAQARWFANRQNGRPCLVPDGTGQIYSITMSLPSGSFSMFSAQKPGTASGVMALLDAATGRLIFATRGNDADSISWYDGSYHNIATSGTGFGVRAWVLTSGGNGEVFLDGVSLGTAAYTAAAIGGAIGLFGVYPPGTGFNLDEDFGECFLVTGTPAAATPALARSYLKPRWATP